MIFKSYGKINFGFSMKRKYIAEEPYIRGGHSKELNWYLWTGKTLALHHRFTTITRNCVPSELFEYILDKWNAYLDKCRLVLNENKKWTIDFESHTKHKLWRNYSLRLHLYRQRVGFEETGDWMKIYIHPLPTGKFYSLIRSLIRYWEVTYHLRNTYPLTSIDQEQ